MRLIAEKYSGTPQGNA